MECATQQNANEERVCLQKLFSHINNELVTIYTVHDNDTVAQQKTVLEARSEVVTTSGAISVSSISSRLIKQPAR